MVERYSRTQNIWSGLKVLYRLHALRVLILNIRTRFTIAPKRYSLFYVAENVLLLCLSESVKEVIRVPRK